MPERETWYHLTVYLASDEWGNEKMREVALAEFKARPEIANKLVVEVREHAGWFLEFLEDGTTVGTANDGARFEGRAKAARERMRGAEWVSLPEIRRQGV